MATPFKKTNKQIKDALTKYKFITPASKALGCFRHTLSKKIRENLELQEHFDSVREEFVDLAENKLFFNVQRGDPASIFFTLKCLGKNRGYVERQEITGKDGGTLLNKTISFKNEREVDEILEEFKNRFRVKNNGDSGVSMENTK